MNPVSYNLYQPSQYRWVQGLTVPALKQDQVLFSGRERQLLIPEEREEALWSSAESGDLELLKDVLEYVKQGKFDLNASTDRGGSRAVHRAAGFGNLEWLKLAHEEGGADLWVRRDNGSLPIDLARRGGFQEIVAYLEAQQAKGTANPSEKKKGWLGRCKKLLHGCVQGLQKAGQFLLKQLKLLKEKLVSWMKSLKNS